MIFASFLEILLDLLELCTEQFWHSSFLSQSWCQFSDSGFVATRCIRPNRELQVWIWFPIHQVYLKLRNCWTRNWRKNRPSLLRAMKSVWKGVRNRLDCKNCCSCDFVKACFLNSNHLSEWFQLRFLRTVLISKVQTLCFRFLFSFCNPLQVIQKRSLREANGKMCF